MEKTHKIASAIILMCSGVFMSLSDIKNALFMLGIFTAISGLQILIETIENTEHEN